MFNKEFFEPTLPDGPQLWRVVANVLISQFGIDAQDVPTHDFEVGWLLTTIMADMEKDRHWGYTDATRPPWKNPDHPDADLSEWNYQVTIRGLDYKQWSNYLTLEGWPTGTTCWYMTVEWGWREHVTAATPLLAVLRTVVVLGAVKRMRIIPPKKRPRIQDVIKDMMLEK